MAEAEPQPRRTFTELFDQDWSLKRPGRGVDYSFNKIDVAGIQFEGAVASRLGQ